MFCSYRLRLSKSFLDKKHGRTRMARAKQASKRNRRSKAVPVLGAAGLSLSLASGASASTSGQVAMLRRKTPRQITKSFSVTRKSRTSACRRSMCSTRKMPHNLNSANRSPGAAGDVDAAAAGAVVAGAAGEVAGAVAAAEAVAGPGASVAGVRSNNAKSM